MKKKILELIRIAGGSQLAEITVENIKRQYYLELPDSYWVPIVESLKKQKALHELYQYYEENYSEEEIDELLEFYRSPLGQKTVALTPMLNYESFSLSREWSASIAEKLRKDGFIREAEEIFMICDGYFYGGISEGYIKTLLRNNIAVETVDDQNTSIILPMFKTEGGMYKIYLNKTATGYLLSDNGVTYTELDKIFEMKEHDVIKNLIAVLRQYGCRAERDTHAFVVDCTHENIHIKLGYLIQALSFMLNMKIFYTQ
ncbi:MAG: DUF2059 domain-containing protein [Candidatus Cloacimonetes bacterium]|nr:DUF2059 domain-containing protein [Candidatus Cloacimonadota bacterium]